MYIPWSLVGVDAKEIFHNIQIFLEMDAKLTPCRHSHSKTLFWTGTTSLGPTVGCPW